MVLESEAACPKCLNENGFTIMLAKDSERVFRCKFGHKFMEKDDGYLKPVM